MKAFEVNFDGIVGPTHNYSGLSYGNIASIQNRELLSNPKQAALQSLAKMKFLMNNGIKQGVFPPQERPNIPILRSLGFSGSNQEVLSNAFSQSPELLFACSSSSSMWAANAATISPSADSADKRVHITPANLSSKFHRSIEPPTTSAIFKAIFPDPKYVIHHPELNPGCYLTDEGAANHTRFCHQFGDHGVQLFVYGRQAFQQESETRFPARQSLEASQAIVRLHQLNNDKVIFAQQNPRAIDAGVFHNDVISVGNQNLFFFHEAAFLNTEDVIREIGAKMKSEMNFIRVPENRISLDTAVATYLFNSQIVSMPEGEMHLIAPSECLENDAVKQLIEEIVNDDKNPISCVSYVNLRESMRNGGGPACLRLRIVLNENELASVNQGSILTPSLYEKLVHWVERHYRDSLSANDLVDPKLLDEVYTALDELSKILNIGSIYSFQKSSLS